jgi:hypothetical protein
MGNVTITPQDEFDNSQFSLSGAFRTVTSSAQSANNNALAPVHTNGPFSPYPMTPYQQNNGMQSYPQWPVQSER